MTGAVPTGREPRGGGGIYGLFPPGNPLGARPPSAPPRGRSAPSQGVGSESADSPRWASQGLSGNPSVLCLIIRRNRFQSIESDYQTYCTPGGVVAREAYPRASPKVAPIYAPEPFAPQSLPGAVRGAVTSASTTLPFSLLPGSSRPVLACLVGPAHCNHHNHHHHYRRGASATQG